MRASLVTGFLVAAFAAAAHAQTYKWVDKDGRTRYGDRPPTGVKAKLLSPPAAPASGAAASGDAAKDANRGPLTPAEQELEFRRRIKEAQEAAAKQERERREAEERKANCARAKEALATLQSGQRIARTDASGERYYLDDAQREQEAAKARESVASWCK